MLCARAIHGTGVGLAICRRQWCSRQYGRIGKVVCAEAYVATAMWLSALMCALSWQQADGSGRPRSGVFALR